MRILVLFIIFILSSINPSAAISGNSHDDGGWTSSGGEYIIEQNNPWFMGRKPVKWCIDHGGSDKFSLSLEDAKIEIANVIENLSSQLKSINRHSGDFYDTDKEEMLKRKKCVFTNNGCAYLSDTFIYTQDCANADIEIILGNYNNLRVKSFIESTGLIKFKKMAGIAVRTEYSISDFRSKGFIYIAADLGDIQYSGSRNIEFKSRTIWDYHKKLNPLAPIPEEIKSSIKDSNLIHSLKLKEYSLGALTSVIAHEFGHVLGFSHNHYNNIMDEDYPANIVKTGLAFKGNFLRESMIISRGLIETDISRKLGFEWSYNKINNEKLISIKQNDPLIFEFLFGIGEKFKLKSTSSLFFIFDQLDPAMGSLGVGHLTLATIENGSLNYKVLTKYSIEFSDKCQTQPQEPIERIILRSEKPDQGAFEWIYDEQLNKWINPTYSSYSTVSNIQLLSFANNSSCGVIYLDEDRKLLFTLRQKYFVEKPQMEIYDPKTNNGETLNFDESDLLIPLNFSNLYDSQLPPISPVLYFPN